MKAYTRKLNRIKHMSFFEIFHKVKEKLVNIFSFRNNVRRLAYQLDKLSIKMFEDNYQEAVEEEGSVNIEIKLKRVANGGPFEPYDVSLVNRAAVTLIGNAKNIVEIGCGTGMFASMAARQDLSRRIVASEFNSGALEWAKKNRAVENIEFCNKTFDELKDRNFDLAVAIEVIEHVREFSAFLEDFSQVADKAIITTPNKNRSAFASIANTPEYGGHVREWTAGELFWVLRNFYEEVQLYTIPDFNHQLAKFIKTPDFFPVVEQCSVLCRDSSLIAVCGKPGKVFVSTDG